MYRVLRFGLAFFWFIAAATVSGAAAEPSAGRFTGPWNLAELKKGPQATWGNKSGKPSRPSCPPSAPWSTT